MKNILVVCVGNICRSPVAEGLLRQQLPQARVWSAGLAALVGRPADPLAVEIAREHGVDISAHRAQQVVGWMCSEADLVLVMETAHKRDLERHYPLARGKIHRLGEFGPRGAYDVADPYRKSRPAFEAAHQAIAEGVAEWSRRIMKIA